MLSKATRIGLHHSRVQRAHVSGVFACIVTRVAEVRRTAGPIPIATLAMMARLQLLQHCRQDTRKIGAATGEFQDLWGENINRAKELSPARVPA